MNNMNFVKKRKIKKWISKHKVVLISTCSFALLGLTGALIGFEIANDWHAIRNWLASPWATTFFICVVIGVVALFLLVLILINVKHGGEE